MSAEARWLDLDLVDAFVPMARAWKVSEVARSKRGFLPQYVAAGGDPDRLTPYWRNRRNNFVARHWAQIRTRGEPLFLDDGLPTRRLLALIMWAAAPTVSDARLIRCLEGG